MWFLAPLTLQRSCSQGPWREGKSCLCTIIKFTLVLKEPTILPTCLPSTAEVHNFINNKQSTFPSVPNFTGQSKAIGGQGLCPGRSPRFWGCCIGTGLTGEEEEEEEGGSPRLQQSCTLQ